GTRCFCRLAAKLLQLRLAGAELRGVSRGPESGTFVDPEGTSSHSGDVADVRKSFGRLDESEERHAGIRRLRVDNVILRIVRRAGPILAAAKLANRGRLNRAAVPAHQR